MMMSSSQSHMNVGIGIHDVNLRDLRLGFSNFGNNDGMLSLKNRVCLSQSRNMRDCNDRGCGYTLKAAKAADAVPAETVSEYSSSSGASLKSVSPL